ncbi:MAG: TetR/AcrR family transcriptional regulator [Mycobacterium kyogaense]|uniref:TetR/AcrR family transcriptional regulator n=1 Tax=Mycobacterium kyogaense TaxID=2212479 RepID=UPI002FFB4899
MPRTSERGGPMTRRKISDVATRMFLDRGFDEVTVAQVAKEAGVSSVTVFKHFPRKEDLLFDRVDDAVEILRAAVRDRGAGSAVLASLGDAAFRLVDERHALSGVKDGSIPFYRTVAGSPVLIARLREIAAELVQALRDALDDDPEFTADPGLFATLVIAGYSTVLTGTAQRVVAEGSPDPVVEDHRHRLGLLFDALQNGLAG